MADSSILEERDRPYGGFEAPATERLIGSRGFDGQAFRDKLLALALVAVGSRSLVWVATLGGGALWTWAVMNPQPLRLVAALGYCVSVLLPVMWRDQRGG